MPDRGFTLRRWLAAAISTTAFAATGSAQERPDVVLRYDGLTTRQTFKFKTGGSEHSKAVGGLGWQFPSSALATVGFDPNPVTFCIEPLVPITAGQEYGFTIDSFGKPKDFAGLKADKPGTEAADKRAKYVRELFAKHYADAVKDDGTASAFQVAVWELVSETELPKAPAAYSLYSGNFQAVEPLAQAPAFVQTAEGYLKGLTGDDSGFATAPLLAGRELVRLSGTNVVTGEAAQAQVAVRNRGGVNNLVSPFGDEPQSFGGLGGGRAPILNGLRSGIGGGGGFGGGGGGVGGGGFFGGVPGVISPTSPPPPGTDTNPGGTNPISPGSPPVSPPPGVPPIPPVPPVPPVSPPPGVPPVSPPPPGVPPVSPPPPGVPPIPPVPPVPPVSPPPDPDPVPAPPALLLGVIAAGVFGVRKLLKKSKADEPKAIDTEASDESTAGE